MGTITRYQFFSDEFQYKSIRNKQLARRFYTSPTRSSWIASIIKKQGPILYYITLTCLFIQNYYFGYMVAIFLTLWTLVQLSWIDSQRIKRFIKFTIVSILSALSSMFMLLPTYLDLKTHGETFTKIVNLKTEDSWYLDFFAKTQLVALIQQNLVLFP